LAAAAILVAQFIYGGVRVAQIDARVAMAPTIAVGLVQANIGIYTKTDSASLLENVLLHQELSADLEERGAELIIWPETAYGPPAYYAEGDDPPTLSRVLLRDSTRLPPSSLPLPSAESPGPATSRLADLVPPQRGFTTPLLTGTLFWQFRTDEERANAPTRGGTTVPIDIFNSAALLDEDGFVLGTYDKTYRMIFSEYLPGAYALFRLTGFSIYEVIPVAGDFRAGAPTDGLVLPFEGEDIRIGIMICYEDIMPSFGRAIHAGRPEFIVNITNDAWFLDTSEPELHLALSVFRTIEQRTSLIRSTNTGISAVMDPVGRVVASTDTFVKTTLLHEVPRLAATTTPFMLLGNWPGWLGGLTLLGVAIHARRKKSAADLSV
jgi:apolipoprotein N-acyltransferase